MLICSWVWMYTQNIYFAWSSGEVRTNHQNLPCPRGRDCTVRKEISSWYTKSERHELIRVVFWNNPCSTSDYSLHFISFLTVRGYSNIFMSACLRSQLLRENRIRVVFYHAYTWIKCFEFVRIFVTSRQTFLAKFCD